MWQEGNERQAMPSSKPIGAEAPEPDSTSSEGDTGKPWGQSARARDKRSLIEAYKHALFCDGMGVTREKQWS